MVASQFGSALDERAGRAASSAPPQRAAVERGQGAPAVRRRARVARSSTRPSRRPPCSAYRVGLGVGGGLTILGGVISLIGIVNPERRPEPSAREAHGATELIHPCPELQRREREAALAG